tara:strand:+ start:650 stop:1435 length:786 start_codon:yes stop_codon:yes gene_type:complete
MAETLTYDAGTDTISTEDNLNAEEQDSLKVGEALLEEQENLLAGKYKSAEELEKAYVELQKKLGSETEASSDKGETVKEEEVEISPIQSSLAEAAKEWETNQTLSDETLEKFKEIDSSELVKTYMELYVQANETSAEPKSDLTETETNNIYKSVGGEQKYGEMIQWYSNNTTPASRDAFNKLIESGSSDLIQLAVDGIKAQYENANGYEGRMLTGKAPASSSDVFRSQAEVVAAMSDPRYDKDPAYRQDLMNKLDRSNINF